MLSAANAVLDSIPPGWADIGAKGLVVLTVLMILTGRLVPGKERDYWRNMAVELKDQNSKLIAGAETQQQFFRAAPLVRGREE